MVPLGVKICSTVCLYSAVACPTPPPLPERVCWLVGGSSLGDPHTGAGCCGRWMQGAHRPPSVPLAHVNTGAFWSDSHMYLLVGSIRASETPGFSRLRQGCDVGQESQSQGCVYLLISLKLGKRVAF